LEYSRFFQLLKRKVFCFQIAGLAYLRLIASSAEHI